MTFSPGDRVHVAALGKGIVREVRNGDRYLVEIQGRSVVTAGNQLTSETSPRKAFHPKPVRAVARTPDPYQPAQAIASLDLHGYTVEEALEALSMFLNQAFLAGSGEIRIIHGRSGGKLKAAVHAQLKRMPSIRRYSLDPVNPGLTIVKL